MFTWVGSEVSSLHLAYLTVLFEQDHCPVVNLKLTVVLQTSHLRGETSSPGDHRKKYDDVGRCVSSWSRAEACTNLNIETLWRLHVLCDVQAVTSTHRTHEVGQRLFILVEPLQLACTQSQRRIVQNNDSVWNITLKLLGFAIYLGNVCQESHVTSSAHMWKRTLAGSTLPYSQRSALILSRRSYLMEQVKWWLDSHEHRWNTGELVLTGRQRRSAGSSAGSSGAVWWREWAQGDRPSPRCWLRGKYNTPGLFPEIFVCYKVGRQLRQNPQYGGPLWKRTKLRTKITKITSNNKSKPHTSVWFCSKSASISCRTCRSPSSCRTRTPVSVASIVASLVKHFKLKGTFCLAQLMWSAQIHKSHVLNLLRNPSSEILQNTELVSVQGRTKHWHWTQATVRRSSGEALGLTRWLFRRTSWNY